MYEKARIRDNISTEISNKTYVFQYTSWNKGINTRYYFSLVQTFIFALIVQIILISLLQIIIELG